MTIRISRQFNAFWQYTCSQFYPACLLATVTISALISMTASASTNPSTMALSGNLEVSGGQAAYSLPIIVTPGRAGLQPNFSFTYRNDVGNGDMGVGWGLSGGSSINRCGKSREEDGQWGGVNFDKGDRYCLDGRRLIAVTGKDGGHLTEYRVVSNGFNKIVSFGSGENGPTYFKVWDKSGSVFEYGTTEDSRVELSGTSQIYKWSLAKVTDASKSNHLNYVYLEDGVKGSHRLTEVNYVGGKLEFNYETREDTQVRYFHGAQITNDQRLSSAVVFDRAGAEVGSYQLTYQASPGTQLQNIQYCSNERCSTKIEFGWQNQAIPSYQTAQSTGFKEPRYYDVDHNGVSDVFGMTAQSNGLMAIRKLNGDNVSRVKSFALSGTLNNTTVQTNQCNVNAAEAYLDESGNWQSYCQFTSCSGDSCKYGSSGTNYGDFNGDGRQTVQRGYSVADINGDGLDDRYNFDNPSAGHKYIISGQAEQVLPNHGGRVMKTFGDINGDGYLDVIMGSQNSQAELYVHFFDGKSYGEPIALGHQAHHEKTVLLADLNQDGYPELGVNGKFFNNLRGVIQDTEMLSVIGQLYSVRDVNGDGWVDILTRAHKGAVVDIQYSLTQLQDKITSINQHGVSYTIEYKPATDSSVYQLEEDDPQSVTFPFQRKTPNRYLVSSVSEQGVGYAPIVTEYQYAGAISHVAGSGFMGFSELTKTRKGAVTTKSVTKLITTDLITGGQVKSRQTYLNDILISSQTNEFTTREKQGFKSKYHQYYLTKQTRESYQIVSGGTGLNKKGQSTGIVEKREVTERTFDQFGNVLTEETTLSSDLEGQGTYVTQMQNRILSTGVNVGHAIYKVLPPTASIESKLINYKTDFERYCTDNGEVYFKPIDFLVLLHSEVNIPIIAEKYTDYYKYILTDSQTDLDGLTINRGQVSVVTEAEFTNADGKSCGTFAYQSGADLHEFSTAERTPVELVTETGNKFWQIGTIESSTITLIDATAGQPTQRRSVTSDYKYTNKGLLEEKIVSASNYQGSGTDGKTRTERFQYDVYGNIIAQSISGTKINMRRSTITYDTYGLFPVSQTNAMGHTTLVSYNNKGELQRSTAALASRQTSYEYDVYGRVKSETLPGIANTYTTQYALGQSCYSATVKTASCISTTAASGQEVITHFDYLGREIRKMHRGFSGQFVVTDTEWNIDGQNISKTAPQFERLSTQPAKSYFDFDILGREIQTTRPADRGTSATTYTQYNGFTTTSQDPLGNEHRVIVNLVGHILEKLEPLNSRQRYRYYPDGKLKTSIDSAGNTTQISYDSLGHRVVLDDPDMGVWNYEYNALGELINKTDANGVTTAITYDLLGRKIRQVEKKPSLTAKTSTWRYDERGALGTLSGFSGNGSQTEIYYNTQGLTGEVAVTVNNERFSTRYVYDAFERMTREIRPSNSTTNSLAVEYVYNPYGYLSAVRSPRSFADEVFESAAFREEIRELITLAVTQAEEYLTSAERYASQTQFFNTKAEEYSRNKVNVHNLDANSQQLLGDEYRYKQWCNDQKECFLRPATWAILSNEVNIPLNVTVEGAIYKLITALADSSSSGVRTFNASLVPVTKQEFSAQSGMTEQHEFVLADYDGDGESDLTSAEDIYIAKANGDTYNELLFTANELTQASAIAQTRYQYYVDLANELVSLAEQVADLSGMYCEFANQLGGEQIDPTKRSQCDNTQTASQADMLNTILTNAELAAASSNQAYIYYWQRRETDAYDHTLSEMLGNGLVNTYQHDANTGRPSYITTHQASGLFHGDSTSPSSTIRYLEYRYDKNNNVTYRYDRQLGITDRWTYDAQDRVVSNSISLDNPAQQKKEEESAEESAARKGKTNLKSKLSKIIPW